MIIKPKFDKKSAHYVSALLSAQTETYRAKAEDPTLTAEERASYAECAEASKRIAEKVFSIEETNGQVSLLELQSTNEFKVIQNFLSH